MQRGKRKEDVLGKSKTEAFLINFVEVLRDEGDLHCADFFEELRFGCQQKHRLCVSIGKKKMRMRT